MLHHVRLQSRLVRTSPWLIYMVMLIAATILSGWIFGLELLKHPLPTNVLMNPLTAFLFIISGISFLLLRSGKTGNNFTGRLLAILVALVALLKLAALYPQLNFGLDYFLLRDKLVQAGSTGSKVSMNIGSSVCFVLNSSILLLLAGKSNRSFRAGQVLIACLLVIAWFSFISYLYRVDSFYKIFTYVPMSIYAAICFLLMVVAHLFSFPGKGIMQLLTSQYSASALARRLIPAAIIIPTFLGFLRIEGHGQSLFTREFGVAALILSITLLFIGIIWYSASILIKREKENGKAEDILRYNDSLLQNISDAIISTDIELKIRTWNRHAETLYEYTSVEVEGKNLEGVLRTKYPEGISYQAIGEKFMSSGSWAGELIHFTKSGKKLNVFISTSLLSDQQGNPIGTVTVVRDISLRKKAEEALIDSELRLQAIIDTYDGPIYAKDKDGRYIVWNKASEQIGGYTISEAIGKTADELFPPAAANIARQRDEQIFAVKKPLQFDWEWSVGSQKRMFSITLFPMYNAKGEVYGSCGVALDITSRMLLERNLREFNADLELQVAQRTLLLKELTEHLNTVRENERMEIAREIHDELGQQMTVLKMDVSWLKRKLPDGDKETEEKINELNAMINQTITTIRRIASELRPAVLDHMGLTAAIEWQLNDLEKRFNIKTTFTHHDIPILLPEKVKTVIFRILQESLTNVARHANASAVDVNLSFGNNMLELTVKDNGKGFESDKMSRKTLGILGMKERAAAINGKYLIESLPGKGTTVKVQVATDPALS